ncbi:hypothetical protein [Brumimicrobium aurantiacum]|uniref:Uncharacterized protein n=1 Tax=Brumimicrobium aurantiacum TaxID=1737063 RepID=A0A3E1EUF6_9FLAO|nr:hypothetical protein [Brumimicrobium aurantiacum]RFC53185.1 hypothetical protein DXU93_14035 [Brumimicrobium aurantiacum]
MNEYIKNKANELIDEHIKRGLWNTEELLSKISSQLYEIKSERDKIDMITLILEANELRNIKQQSGNFNNDNGATKVKYLEINYFLHQELEEIGVRPSDNFTSEEKER